MSKLIGVIEKMADYETVKMSRAEHDRLLAVEGEYQRLRSACDELLEVLKPFSVISRCADCGKCRYCRLRAAIARAKGEGE